ncbi:MAG: DUF4198 domain-containing protein [Candidatus Eisenbacteria bacterium]|nr:DUF4198 domain-containing protein [Candidatus Eisenbacteria bacterium]
MLVPAPASIPPNAAARLRRAAMRTLPLIVLLLPTGAAAHDLWIERDAEGWTLLRGHRHSVHAGEAVLPYSPETLEGVTCVAVSGEALPCAAAQRYPLRVPEAGQAAVCFQISSGYWTQTPYGTRNAPPAQVKQAIRSWHSREGAKRIAEWSAAFTRPLTSGLELVPLEDPFALEAGEKLHLRVTLRDAPCADAIVSYFGEPRGRSGEEGTINVRLRQDGLQMIEASFSEPDSAGVCEEIVHAATLNFLLPEAP